MNMTTLSYFQQGLWMAVLLSAPPLLIATIFGLAVSLVQAVTQVQDQTLPYVCKLVAVSVVLAMMGRWIGSELMQLCNLAFNLIPTIGR